MQLLLRKNKVIIISLAGISGGQGQAEAMASIISQMFGSRNEIVLDLVFILKAEFGPSHYSLVSNRLPLPAY